MVDARDDIAIAHIVSLPLEISLRVASSCAREGKNSQESEQSRRGCSRARLHARDILKLAKRERERKTDILNGSRSHSLLYRYIIKRVSERAAHTR